MDFQAVVLEDMNWIVLVLDGDRWQAVLNAAMNLRFPYKGGEDLLASPEGLCSMELDRS